MAPSRGKRTKGGGLLGSAGRWMLRLAGLASAVTFVWQWQALSLTPRAWMEAADGLTHHMPEQVPRATLSNAVSSGSQPTEPSVAAAIPTDMRKPAASLGSSGAKHKIFTYWEYPKGPNPFVQLNLESWRRFSPPGTEIIFVNNSNFQKLVPDAPEEWFRLPYAAAKSDVVRASLLYHHGGLYMDTDFLVLNDLSPVFDKLDQGWDIVAYTDGCQDNPKEHISGDCSASGSRYSSNFMAGRKGNSFSATWWKNIKYKLTRMCGEGEMKMEKICCHEAFAPLPEKRPCHIPWAQLEHLKTPENDHDGKGPPRKDPTQKHDGQGQGVDRTSSEARAVLDSVARGNERATQVPGNTKVYCMRGREGMAPYCVGQIYWQAWDPVAGRTNSKPRDGLFDPSFSCYMENDDMICDHTHEGKKQRKYPGFFKHFAYHLFFSSPHSAAKKTSVKSKEEILKYGWLLSEMYRRVLDTPSLT